MRIALAQISSGTEPLRNAEVIADVAARAAQSHAELVIFPEAAHCRFGVPLFPIAESTDGPWASTISEIAQRNSIAIAAGMFTPSTANRVHNTILFCTSDGKRFSYNKIHLYDAFGFKESTTVAPGTEPTLFPLGNEKIGVATCYDIRFPALFHYLATTGARLIIVPASWGDGPGKREQWQLLAQARALDSGSFIAAVGQARQPHLTTSAPTGIGHSMLISPEGTILSEAGENSELLFSTINLADADLVRTQIGMLANTVRLQINP